MRTVLGLVPLTLSVLLLLCSCTSPEPDKPIGEEIPSEPLLLALEAYRGNDQYFLRYLRGGEEYFVAGDLKGRSPPREAASYESPAVLPMQTGELQDWAQLSRALTPIPVLGIEQWAAFRDHVFTDFLPREKNTGVAVSFERGDYFFFYDSEDRFRARRLIEKPPWYQVVAHVDLVDYFERWQPVLQQFLTERGLSGGEVLFNTGDLDRGAFPFIYVNTRSRLIVLMRYDELPENLQGELPGTHLIQSLWHFIGSHSYNVIMRPFSTVRGLLSLVTDTAVETGRTLLQDIPADSAIPPLYEGPGMDLQAWERELDDRLGRPASRGQLDFLVDGEVFFPRLLAAVTSASESVDVRTYIFDNDDLALEIAELLKRRSREGIDVRVLFDGLGTRLAAGEHSTSLPEDHQSSVSISGHLKEDSQVAVRSVKNTWLAGDHVKTMTVDRSVAFIGGMNIGREYRYDWHDLMVEVTGPIVDEINDEFQAAWHRAGWLGDFAWILGGFGSDTNEDSKGYPVRLVHTAPGQQEIYTVQRDAIRQARRYIYIENAYFTDDALLRELVLARRRGVDVRVVIPVETDRGLITRNNVLAANTLFKHGVRVYIYPGFTHAKAAIFDGWASVGSANLDRLSLHINREMNICTSEPAAVEELLAELFQPDFERSIELTEPLPERWTDYLIEKFGDYLF